MLLSKKALPGRLPLGTIGAVEEEPVPGPAVLALPPLLLPLAPPPATLALAFPLAPPFSFSLVLVVLGLQQRTSLMHEKNAMDNGRDRHIQMSSCNTISNSHADVWFVLWLIRQWHGRREVASLPSLVVSLSLADVARIVIVATTRVNTVAVDQGTASNQRGNRPIIFAKPVIRATAKLPLRLRLRLRWRLPKVAVRSWSNRVLVDSRRRVFT